MWRSHPSFAKEGTDLARTVPHYLKTIHIFTGFMTFTITNPARLSEQVGEVAISSEADVEQALTAASTAFAAWSNTMPDERAARLRAGGAAIKARLAELTPLFVRENGLTDLMAHEFHHMYAGDFSRMSRTGIGAGDAPIIGVFWSLRNEGIADMVDKPYPLTVRSEAMASYAKGYNETYEKTPVILRAIDSLIVGAIGDSAKLVAAAQQARTLIPWNGHPNGAYMARSIKDTFGVDSLFPALASPFAFVRVFRAAEAKKGNASAFSAPTIAWLDAMEKKYVP